MLTQTCFDFSHWSRSLVPAQHKIVHCKTDGSNLLNALFSSPIILTVIHSSISTNKLLHFSTFSSVLIIVGQPDVFSSFRKSFVPLKSSSLQHCRLPVNHFLQFVNAGGFFFNFIRNLSLICSKKLSDMFMSSKHKAVSYNLIL
jgi:hypothetical protein